MSKYIEKYSVEEIQCTNFEKPTNSRELRQLNEWQVWENIQVTS